MQEPEESKTETSTGTVEHGYSIIIGACGFTLIYL